MTTERAIGYTVIAAAMTLFVIWAIATLIKARREHRGP
jgi:hypothetical protein